MYPLLGLLTKNYNKIRLSIDTDQLYKNNSLYLDNNIITKVTQLLYSNWWYKVNYISTNNATATITA